MIGLNEAARQVCLERSMPERFPELARRLAAAESAVVQAQRDYDRQRAPHSLNALVEAKGERGQASGALMEYVLAGGECHGLTLAKCPECDSDMQCPDGCFKASEARA